MTTGQRVGIYGGTFDPLHFGHLNLAVQIKEAHQLDEVWFCPVQVSPHKQEYPPTPIEHRLRMLQIALEDVPGCSVTDVEVKKEGPSYTIDTLQALVAQERGQRNPRQFSFIMGDDAIPSFCQWHQPELIVQLVPIWIGRRMAEEVDLSRIEDQKIREALSRGITSTRLIDISATEIRERLRKRLYCGHLIPAKVLDYIYKHELYLSL